MGGQSESWPDGRKQSKKNLGRWKEQLWKAGQAAGRRHWEDNRDHGDRFVGSITQESGPETLGVRDKQQAQEKHRSPSKSLALFIYKNIHPSIFFLPLI